MKSKLLLFVLLAVSCTLTNPYMKDVYDIDKDFPTTDTISFELVQTFNIVPNVDAFTVADSAIFIVEEGVDDFGHCYNINNGEVISTLLGKGSAQNEATRSPLSGVRIKDGNIHFSNQENAIKKFSINEILTKPLGERGVDIIVLPPKAPSVSYIETGDNELFGTLSFGIDDKSYRYFIYAHDSVSYLEELNTKSKYVASKDVTKEQISQALMRSEFESYNNKVVTVGNGIMLQIVDLEKRIIENERFYNKVEIDERGLFERNEYYVANIRCNEKYIYCDAIKYDYNKTTGSEVADRYIYVFDWNLNPVKKYFLGAFNINSNRYYISYDGKEYYYLTVSDEEKQVLYKAEIK